MRRCAIINAALPTVATYVFNGAAQVFNYNLKIERLSKTQVNFDQHPVTSQKRWPGPLKKDEVQAKVQCAENLCTSRKTWTVWKRKMF